MTHVTEEEMIAEVYGEGGGEGGQTVAVERHLAGCAECAQAFAELKRDLTDLDRVEVPEREAGYGERVWASIAPRLKEYAPEKRRWWKGAGAAPGWMRGLGYAAACALLVGGAFYAGRVWEQQQHPGVTAVNQAPAPPVKQPAKQPIVVVVLDDHLDRSERFLVELKHADVDPAQMASPLRDEARSLLAANRVCRKNLAQAPDPEVATALGHLDSLLTEAANAPGGLNAQAIAKLQDEMSADGLLFEVRVLRSRITNHKGTGVDPAKANSAKGETI